MSDQRRAVAADEVEHLPLAPLAVAVVQIVALGAFVANVESDGVQHFRDARLERAVEGGDVVGLDIHAAFQGGPSWPLSTSSLVFCRCSLPLVVLAIARLLAVTTHAVREQAGAHRDRCRHASGQAREVVGGTVGLAHDIEEVARGIGIGDAESDCGAAADSLHLLDGPLELRRVVFLAADDDHVLRSPGDAELAALQVAEVAGIQPAIAQHSSGHIGQVPVALHHRGARDLDAAEPSFWQHVAVLVGDYGRTCRARASRSWQ